MGYGASRVSKVSEIKNRPIILFYAFVRTANGLEYNHDNGSFRHAALLFGDILYYEIS